MDTMFWYKVACMVLLIAPAIIAVVIWIVHVCRKA